MEWNKSNFHYYTWENPTGERDKDAIRLNFDQKLKREFHRGFIMNTEQKIVFCKSSNGKCRFK
jgi:hypothetical protein